MAAANLQTIIVSKAVAKTRTKAEQLARPHARRLYTSRETPNSWRFRQRPPTDFKKNSFRTFPLPGHHGITFVYGDLKASKREKNPKGGRIQAGRQRHLQYVGKEGIEDINRDWDFWLEMQGKVAKARSKDMIQVLALSTRRRRIQSVTIKGLIMGAIADRARELRFLRTRPTAANDERYYNELVGDNPGVSLRQTSKKRLNGWIVARYVSRPFNVIIVVSEVSVNISIYIGGWGPEHEVYTKAAAASKRLLPGDKLNRAVKKAEEIIQSQGVTMRRQTLQIANPKKKHAKKKAKKKTAKKRAKKGTGVPKAKKLRAPKIMPDPGPSAWCGSTLEFAIKPNGGPKPKWVKIDEKGNWLWEGGLKREWLFLWSPEYKAVIAIPRPRGLKGGIGRKLARGEVRRDGGGAKMFERFAARAPEQTQGIEIPEVPLQKVGDAVHIVYRADKWSAARKTTDYIHDFKSGVQLYCGPSVSNPKVFLCFGGKLTMTERGLVF